MLVMVGDGGGGGGSGGGSSNNNTAPRQLPFIVIDELPLQQTAVCRLI